MGIISDTVGGIAVSALTYPIAEKDTYNVVTDSVQKYTKN